MARRRPAGPPPSPCPESSGPSGAFQVLGAVRVLGSPGRPHGGGELIRARRRGLLPSVTDTCVRLWRRVHMDLLRYAGCVCRPSF
ncbi:putative leader peptide [Streptomyces prasinopilosus]